MQILLVEDNPGDVRLIHEGFRENPYPEKFEIIDCGSLSEASQVLSDPEKRKKIGAILLDLALPDSIGLKTLKKIQPHTNGIPIIILTGLDDYGVALQALKEGAQDYLIKNQALSHLVIKSILYAVERKNVEEAKYQNKLAEEVNRKKSQFLAMLSHEMRNPLGVIVSCAGLLAVPGGKNNYEVANTIKVSANHLNALINDTLDLSRIEAGQINLERTLFDVAQEIETTCEGLKKQAAMKGLEWSFAFDGSTPQFIRTDSTRLRQIIYNLVGNAIKFTAQGGISIHVRGGAQKQSLDILVKDTGCGIAQDDRSNLFQPFGQANQSVYRQYKGTGLGLALSKKLAECLGGNLVLLESNPGKGSTFMLSIDTGLSGPEETSHTFAESERNCGSSSSRRVA